MFRDYIKIAFYSRGSEFRVRSVRYRLLTFSVTIFTEAKIHRFSAKKFKSANRTVF